LVCRDVTHQEVKLIKRLSVTIRGWAVSFSDLEVEF
jgi:hypothetical protein